MHQAILTVDLGFGDAGKGSIVDFLTRETAAHTVVRYNGGAQAGHRVVTDGPDAQEHVFAQFGSGTLAGAATHLSRFMLVDPLAMEAEAAHLHSLGIDAFGRTTIDRGARIITPFQRAANRLKELARGAARHGSCGMGIGETAADALALGERTLRAGDLARPDVLVAKLRLLRKINRAKNDAIRHALPDDAAVAAELAILTDADWLEWLIDAYGDFVQRAHIVAGDHLAGLLRRPGTVIFEGAQGVLLDEHRGFHPHTTWSNTTLRNAEQLLGEAGYAGAVRRVGITRAYATRHGAGPFVSEDAGLTRALPDAANGFGAWQQGFRAGWLDLVMLRYAAEVAGPLDCLAVTCLDRMEALPAVQFCAAYRCDGQAIDRIAPSPVCGDLAHQERLTGLLGRCTPILRTVEDTADLLAAIAASTGVPVSITSLGPAAGAKRWRATASVRARRTPADEMARLMPA